MMSQQAKGCMLLAIVCCSSILPILAAPPQASEGRSHHHQHGVQGRKFYSKPSATKKIYHKQQQQAVSTEKPDQLISQTKQQQDITIAPQEPNGPGGFPWALARPMMELVRMFLGVPTEMNANSLGNGIDKMDTGAVGPGQGFSWGQVIGYGLKLLLAALGGGNNGHDGIDKMDAGASPVQGLVKTLIGTLVGGEDVEKADNMAKQTGELINMAMALMNALKASFSQRALRARSLGEKDRMTEITLAAIDMGKAYAKTFNTTDEGCKQMHICQAARDCVTDVGQPNAFGLCHFTAYATANLMYYTQPSLSVNKEATKLILEAARHGRALEECKKLYECNETP